MENLYQYLAFMFALFCLLNNGIRAYTPAAVRDQVVNLPGAESAFKSHHFSGFFNISATSYIHYMYIESENNPANDPVIFWTNGGPGCSGLLALFTEFGPWRPTRNGGLEYNPYTWTKQASIVFLEQPIGVGFSHSTEANPLTNDFRASKDNLLSVKAFFARYPERAGNPFYLASESYGALLN